MHRGRQLKESSAKECAFESCDFALCNVSVAVSRYITESMLRLCVTFDVLNELLRMGFVFALCEIARLFVFIYFFGLRESKEGC